jgi:hypothetical protein
MIFSLDERRPLTILGRTRILLTPASAMAVQAVLGKTKR